MKITDVLVEGAFGKNLYYQVDNQDKNSALKVQQHFPFYPTKTEGIWKCPIMKNESFQTEQKKRQILNHLFTPIIDIKKHLKGLKEFADTVPDAVIFLTVIISPVEPNVKLLANIPPPVEIAPL